MTSKVDAMRALREARYAAAAKGAATGKAAPKAAPRAAPKPATQAPEAAPRAAATTPVPAVTAEGLCGHRNISGRSCTREAEHVRNGTKNHRYG